MRRVLRPLSLLAFLLPPCAMADSVNFALNGTLQDGGTVTGVLEVNTSAGYVNPTKVTVFDGGRMFTFVGSFYAGVYPGTNPLEFYSTSYNQENDNLLLSFPTLLQGYTGGSLCSTTVVCQGFTSSFTPYPGKAIEFTTLTASAVPEPGSLALLGTGILAGLAALRRCNAAHAGSSRY